MVGVNDPEASGPGIAARRRGGNQSSASARTAVGVVTSSGGGSRGGSHDDGKAHQAASSSRPLRQRRDKNQDRKRPKDAEKGLWEIKDNECLGDEGEDKEQGGWEPGLGPEVVAPYVNRAGNRKYGSGVGGLRQQVLVEDEDAMVGAQWPPLATESPEDIAEGLLRSHMSELMAFTAWAPDNHHDQDALSFLRLFLFLQPRPGRW